MLLLVRPPYTLSTITTSRAWYTNDRKKALGVELRLLTQNLRTARFYAQLTAKVLCDLPGPVFFLVPIIAARAGFRIPQFKVKTKVHVVKLNMKGRAVGQKKKRAILVLACSYLL